MGRVAELWIYPVKGCRGIRLDESAVHARGLTHDRRWMVVDAATGRAVTQRDQPALAGVFVELDDVNLSLTVPGSAATDVPITDQGAAVPVIVWGDQVLAVATTAEADALLSRHLERTVRLVRFPESAVRPCDPAFAQPGDHTAFADGFPILVTTVASLEELLAALVAKGEPALPMSRFRPNIVVEGVPPRAEDGMPTLILGQAVFDLVKPCDRCVVTTVDQETAHRHGPEPIRTLGEIRRNPKTRGVYFGQNAILRSPSAGPVTIREGDACRFGTP